MSPADGERIEHMLEAARDALSFVHGRERQDLASDRMLLFSLERAVEIIGEAANKVSVELRWNFAQRILAYRGLTSSGCGTG